MMGRLPVFGEEGQDISSQTENRYCEFARNPNNRALNSYAEDGTLVPGFFGDTTGDPVIDDLINGMMHPDPSQRLSPEQVLNHPAFQQFDGDLGHELIEQLLQ